MMEIGHDPRNVEVVKPINRDEMSIPELQQELKCIDVEIDTLRASLGAGSLSDVDRRSIQDDLDFQIALWLDTGQYIALRRRELV